MPSRAEVLAVARLARLTFSSDELDRVAFELRGILAHVEELKQVAAHAAAGARTGEVAVAPRADGAPPDGAVRSALRPDVPGADPLGLPPSGIATEWRDGFFTVPRLRTHDTAGG